ncbi:hypothetical protein [Marinomonas posidonica]|uniref:hypothetical protein n=1 Tax=Marinomonas posidonica TaxID=936476 RepID=UPI0037368370
MDSIRDSMVKRAEDKGFTFFRETTWSSSLKQKDLSKVRDFLSNNFFGNVDVSLVVPMKNENLDLKWVNYYDAGNDMQPCSTLQNKFIPAGSNNIKLTFCYFSEEEEKAKNSQTLYIVNSLRLIFGVPIARELIFVRRFSTKSDAVMSSDVGYASVFITQSLNMFENPPIEGAELINISEEAMILLDKAFLQKYEIERFILMWLAFEALGNDCFKGKNNGKKREWFCINELKSSLINDEVNRLYRIRCDMFKEGKKSSSTMGDECWSLYAILQLAIMKNCPQRDAFLRGYEKKLLAKNI